MKSGQLIRMSIARFSGGGGHFNIHDGYEIDKCNQCGFVFTKEIPSTDWLKRFYDDQYSAYVNDGVYKPKKTLACSWRGLRLGCGRLCAPTGLQGLDAHVSDVESMHFAPQTFDAVVALHVMEHVQNLDVFIKEIHRVMKQGGYFFAVMPNMSHYKPKLAGASWKFWGPPGHLWYFTNHSLTMFLENHGFEVKHCSSLYHRAHVRVLARKK